MSDKSIEAHVLGVRPGDAIVFLIGEDTTDAEMEVLNHSIDEILGDKEDVTVAVFPKRVVQSIRNLSLQELLTLRDEVEEAISTKATLQSVGEA